MENLKYFYVFMVHDGHDYYDENSPVSEPNLLWVAPMFAIRGWKSPLGQSSFFQACSNHNNLYISINAE